MRNVANFSLEHYEHMVNVGAFDGAYQKPVELIRGEIVMMSPIGAGHADCLDRLALWSFRAAADHGIRIRVQNPLRFPINDSVPEPDLAWVREKGYAEHHPGPEDILLIIEVAESSLETDRTEKRSIYAEARIPEYWIVNLVDKQVEIYREPSGRTYQQESKCRGKARISPLALPQAELALSRVFLKNDGC